MRPAREILDSRGWPTVDVDVLVEGGSLALDDHESRGRRDVVASLEHLLRKGQTALIHGPVGIGKTAWLRTEAVIRAAETYRPARPSWPSHDSSGSQLRGGEQ